jgi:hypothetical protein
MSVVRGPDGELYGIPSGEGVAFRIPTGRSEQHSDVNAQTSGRSFARLAIDDTAALFCVYRRQ